MNCNKNGEWAGALLSIGGFDPLCSAGICADVFSFRSFGFKPFAVPTSLTVQDAFGVHAVNAVDSSYLIDAAKRIFDTTGICGIKVGLIPNLQTALAVADVLAASECDCVLLDPIVKASGGQMLNDSFPHQLMDMVSVITPNLFELEFLSGVYDDIDGAAKSLFLKHKSLKAIVLTGFEKHSRLFDVLFKPNSEPVWVDVLHRRKKELHGTGCHYSSALLCSLVSGALFEDATKTALDFVAKIDISNRFEVPSAPMDIL